MKLIPKNWKSFQHYKHRSPPWVKLHRSLLDDFDYQCLPVASRALAPMLWLLASESDDGTIEATREELAFRLRMGEKDFEDALKPLINKGFFKNDSKTLAKPKQSAVPEIEKSRVEKRESRGGFIEFYKAYPRKEGVGAAEPKYRAALKKASHEEIMAGLKAFKFNGELKFIPHPATWLHQQRWKDEEEKKPEPINFNDPDWWRERTKSQVAKTLLRNDWPVPAKNFPDGCPIANEIWGDEL